MDNIQHNSGIGFIRKGPLKIVFEDIKNYFKEKNVVNVEVVEVLRWNFEEKVTRGIVFVLINIWETERLAKIYNTLRKVYIFDIDKVQIKLVLLVKNVDILI